MDYWDYNNFLQLLYYLPDALFPIHQLPDQHKRYFQLLKLPKPNVPTIVTKEWFTSNYMCYYTIIHSKYHVCNTSCKIRANILLDSLIKPLTALLRYLKKSPLKINSFFDCKENIQYTFERETWLHILLIPRVAWTYELATKVKNLINSVPYLFTNRHFLFQRPLYNHETSSHYDYYTSILDYNERIDYVNYKEKPINSATSLAKTIWKRQDIEPSIYLLDALKMLPSTDKQLRIYAEHITSVEIYDELFRINYLLRCLTDKIKLRIDYSKYIISIYYTIKQRKFPIYEDRLRLFTDLYNLYNFVIPTSQQVFAHILSCDKYNTIFYKYRKNPDIIKHDGSPYDLYIDAVFKTRKFNTTALNYIIKDTPHLIEVYLENTGTKISTLTTEQLILLAKSDLSYIKYLKRSPIEILLDVIRDYQICISLYYPYTYYRDIFEKDTKSENYIPLLVEFITYNLLEYLEYMKYKTDNFPTIEVMLQIPLLMIKKYEETKNTKYLISAFILQYLPTEYNIKVCNLYILENYICKFVDFITDEDINIFYILHSFHLKITDIPQSHQYKFLRKVFLSSGKLYNNLCKTHNYYPNRIEYFNVSLDQLHDIKILNSTDNVNFLVTTTSEQILDMLKSTIINSKYYHIIFFMQSFNIKANIDILKEFIRISRTLFGYYISPITKIIDEPLNTLIEFIAEEIPETLWYFEKKYQLEFNTWLKSISLETAKKIEDYINVSSKTKTKLLLYYTPFPPEIINLVDEYLIV